MPSILTPSGVPRTVRDILTRAMRAARVLGAGEAMDADDAADALLSLNQMLDSWQAERLFVYAVVERQFPLTAGLGVYTLGPAATFTAPRPVRVEWAFTRDAQNYDRGMQIIDDGRFAAITLKTLGNTFPEALFYEATYPNGVVNLWPLPPAALTLHMGCWEVLTQYAGLNDLVQLPPGYEDAIVYSMAERLAPEYGKEATAAVVRIGAKARATVQQNNLPEAFVSCEFNGVDSDQLLPFYRIRAGDF